MAFLNTTQSNTGLLLLRLTFGGIMFFAHGMPKIGHFPSASFPDPFGLGPGVSMSLAIFAECLCAALVCLGLWTRLATIPLIITMLTAVFLVHGSDPFAKKELALLYLMAYGTLFFTGAGDFSIDKKITRHRR